MIQMQWIAYGVTVLSLVFSGISLLCLRHPAYKFNERLDSRPCFHPGEGG